MKWRKKKPSDLVQPKEDVAGVEDEKKFKRRPQ
jgi:hypothetical protein